MAVLVTSAVLNFTHSGFKQPFTFADGRSQAGKKRVLG